MESEWNEVAFGDLFSVKHGFAFKGEHFCEEKTQALIVTPGNFAIGGGFQNGKLKFYDGPISDDYVLEPGQIIVAMTDLSKEADTLGLPAAVPSDDNIWLHNQRIGLLEFNGPIEIISAFANYLLRIYEYRCWVVGSATGTTVKHTSPNRIQSFRCKVPPPPEQKTIAHILGTLDDKIELNRKMNGTLESMARALFKSWFVDFDPVIDKAMAAGNPIPEPLHARAETRRALGNQTKPLPAPIQKLFPDSFIFNEEMGWIPEGWEVKKLVDLTSEIGSGATPRGGSKVYVEKGVALIRSQNVFDSRFVWNGLARITDEAANKLRNVEIEEDDILFNITGASILRTCIVDPLCLTCTRKLTRGENSCPQPSISLVPA